MKNKKTSYFMLPVVLAIWAVIGWKVYAMVKSDPTALPPAQEQGTMSKDDGIVPDTFELLANYRDPFLDEVVTKTSPVIHQSSHDITPSKKEPVVTVPKTFPKLIYYGLVRKSGEEKAVGFLSVNGKSNFVKGGEHLDEIIVGRIWKDSVEVMMGKERRVVRK